MKRRLPNLYQFSPQHSLNRAFESGNDAVAVHCPTLGRCLIVGGNRHEYLPRPPTPQIRNGQVFVYHNGAESYYAARSFRGPLKV